MKNKTLIIITLVGLFLRLFLAMLPGFQIDVNDWFAWATRLNQVGLSNFYNPQVFSDYTPGFLYILGALGFIRNLLHLDGKLFYLLLKIPAILSETVLGVIIYKEVNKHTSKLYSSLAAAFILFNPALIFNSSVWGQIDSILALLLYLAIYYLSNRKLIIASIMLAAAFLIKPQAIAIFPVFLIFFIKKFSVKNFLKLIIPFTLALFILALPFFPKDPTLGLPKLIINTANGYQYTSLFAYNFWGTVGFWISDKQIFQAISYQALGYILFSIYWIIISFYFFKKKLSLYILASLAFLGFYFLPTRVHERYLYPGLIFLIISASLLKSRLLIALTAFLSIIHFLNLYYVYVYYNEVYLKLPKLLYNPFLYNFLDNKGKQFSVISTILFILISIVIIKSNAVSEKV